MRERHTKLLRFCLALTMLAALAACGDDDTDGATAPTADDNSTTTSGDEPAAVQQVTIDGATQEDAIAFFENEAPAGPPPFSGQGGIQGLMPGASQKADVDIEPGDYVLFCAIPDPTDGGPHYEKGMVTTVTVS